MPQLNDEQRAQAIARRHSQRLAARSSRAGAWRFTSSTGCPSRASNRFRLSYRCERDHGPSLCLVAPPHEVAGDDEADE